MDYKEKKALGLVWIEKEGDKDVLVEKRFDSRTGGEIENTSFCVCKKELEDEKAALLRRIEGNIDPMIKDIDALTIEVVAEKV